MVRNCSELGENLQKIVKRLYSNQDLLKYLFYTDKDPLSHEDLTKQEIQDEIFEKLIKVVPRVGPKETAKSIVVVRVAEGSKLDSNDEFKKISIVCEVYVPLTQWFIKETNLRPFAIMGELQKSLDQKTVNGLGKLSGGDFELEFLTDEISCYTQYYSVYVYD